MVHDILVWVDEAKRFRRTPRTRTVLSSEQCRRQHFSVTISASKYLEALVADGGNNGSDGDNCEEDLIVRTAGSNAATTRTAGALPPILRATNLACSFA